MSKILIKNGKVFCYKNGIDGEALDILIEEGKISKVEKNIKQKVDFEIDASNLYVIPGLVDLHVHLREPGFENKETIKTGTMAAVKGGITTLVAMANTNPPIDSPEVYQDVTKKIKENALANVIQACKSTRNENEIVEIGLLKKKGAFVFSDDGKPVQNPKTMKKLLAYASSFEVLIFEHPEDEKISEGGHINDGIKALEMGIQGIPHSSEAVAVARNILLVEETNSSLHLQHISSRYSLDLIRWAKSKNMNITCEVTPHHLILSENDIKDHLDTYKKMNPPLRSEEDIIELRKALKDGTIDVIATDHAPHTVFEKSLTIQEAPFGTTGLETSLAAIFTKLVLETNTISMLDMVRLMSFSPAMLLRMENKGHISVGADADITIFDPNKSFIVDEKMFVSKGKNSAFIGMELAGVVNYTIVSGEVVYANGEYKSTH